MHEEYRMATATTETPRRTIDELRDMGHVTLADLDGYDVVPAPIAGKVVMLGRNASYEAAANGQLPAIRIGRRLVVPVARLRAMVEGDGGGR